MRRLSYALLAGLIGAGLVHIALIFALPSLLPDYAWDRLAKAADAYVAVPLTTAIDRNPLLSPADPAVRAVACRFDLDDGMVRVSATGSVPFWSASIYDRDGSNVYSMTDRSTLEGGLDFIIIPPQRMNAERTSGAARTVYVEAPVSQGIVVVRAVLPDPTWADAVAAFLASTRCTSVETR